MSTTSTVCDHCIFADKEVIPVDLANNCEDVYTHQNGCKLNRLEKHKRNGVNVIPGIDEYGNEFFVLENCVCTAMRTKEWVKLDGGLPDLIPDLDKEVMKELEITYQWILIDNGTLEDIRDRVLEIGQQRIKPGRVVVIRPYESPNDNVAIARLLTKYTKFCNGRWSVENLVEGVSTDEGIDCSLIRFKYPFYIYSNTSDSINKDISDKINGLINEDMLIFGMLTIDNITVVPQTVNSYFQGSAFGKKLRDKLLEECSDKVINVS